jgi:hypothetical protein
MRSSAMGFFANGFRLKPAGWKAISFPNLPCFTSRSVTLGGFEKEVELTFITFVSGILSDSPRFFTSRYSP